MMVEPTVFKYALNIKLSALSKRTRLSELFPNVENLLISSRNFEKFEEAVASANSVALQLAETLNVLEAPVSNYRLMSELNPRHSGKPTLSVDWGHNEVAKLWIIDDHESKKKEGQIKAIALTQLVEVYDTQVPVS